MKTIKNLTADQIRKSILQLAIQGKLVKQDPNDEPASELVKRIYEEKQRLIKEGKIKKDKNESYIYKGDDNCYYEKVGSLDTKLLEDIPFELPNGWTWIRQSNLCWLDNGNKTQSGELPYLEAKVIRHNKPDKYQTSGVVVDSNFKLILVDGENSGEIFTPPFKGYMGSTFKILDVTSEIDFQYLLLIFELNLDLYRNSKTGAAIPHLNKKLFKENLIALPPLNEQLRIVKKILEFDPLLESYQNIEKELSSYETSFEGKLKASILQYAMEGKLVKQNPNDEPASVLLERIKKEKERLIKEGKIKHDKHESEIVLGDDKNYYENNKDITKALPIEEIPNSWCWIRLDTLFAHNTGKALNSKNTTGTNLEYITTSNLYWNNFILNDLKKMYFLPSELQKCIVKKGDLLVCEGGDIGRAAIWNLDKTICIQNHIHRLRPYIFISVEFYLLVLRLYKFTGYIGGKGIGIQGLSTNALGKLFLPLPPIEEQKRISKQVFAILKEYKIAL